MVIDSCCTIGNKDAPEPSADKLLSEMDKVGIDKAVINPPDRCFAWENEAGNELTLRTAQRYPGRFIPTITANPWRTDAWEIISK